MLTAVVLQTRNHSWISLGDAQRISRTDRELRSASRSVRASFYPQAVAFSVQTWVTLMRSGPMNSRSVTHATKRASLTAQAKQDTKELESRGKALKEGIGAAERRLAELEIARDAALAQIGNLVHDSVPVDDDEVRGQGVKPLCNFAAMGFRLRALCLHARPASHPQQSRTQCTLSARGMPLHRSLCAASRVSLLTNNLRLFIKCAKAAADNGPVRLTAH